MWSANLRRAPPDEEPDAGVCAPLADGSFVHVKVVRAIPSSEDSSAVSGSRIIGSTGPSPLSGTSNSSRSSV